MKRYRTPQSLDLASARPTIIPLAAVGAAVGPLLSVAAGAAAAGAATQLMKDDRTVSRLSLGSLVPVHG